MDIIKAKAGGAAKIHKSLKYIKIQNGYTLIEVMACVVIIGIVMAIVIPNYKRVRQNIVEKKAMVNLHSMYVAQKEFYQDKGDDGTTYNDYYTSDIFTLQGYVDFSLDDGHWTYSIANAGTEDFVMEALDKDGHIIQIDQTGSIQKRY